MGGREFVHEGRVRYVETDAMGVAHHSAYLVWMEEARIAALRDLGRSYRELEASGIMMPVVECGIRFKRSLRFDDLFRLRTTMELPSPSRICFRSRFLDVGEALLAEGEVTVAVLDAGGRPRRLPDDLLKVLRSASEAGK